MHPSVHGKTTPDKPAMILAPSNLVVTYGELEARSNQGAQLFRKLGLQPGDAIAICLENTPAFFEVAWAAQRSGLYFVSISSKLQADEVAYILTDSGAKLFITSPALGDLPAQVVALGLDVVHYAIGAPVPGYRDFLKERAARPETPIADEQAGAGMLYSSGTTGRPKGIKPGAILGEPIDAPDVIAQTILGVYKGSADSIYLSPAPLYHAAPMRWCMSAMRLGMTIVIMEKFDAQALLAAVERYHVTMAQFVPTHFVRMLKLPEAIRAKYDVSSLRTVIHAAAPCPIPVKEAMMAWFGPIINEYYAGSEGNGSTFISPEEWLSHKGSVGRPLVCKVHICDENGNEVPARVEGAIYFSGGAEFEYHNDAAKTQESRHSNGWTTLGDIGWKDEEGYLYLTDRKSFMIISGGVNIYPQEIENLLVTHPKVADVAVVGAPDEEMGEKVVAVVQPVDWAQANDALAAELTAFARANLSHVKAPRRVDFTPELPRQATGKLYKRLIRDKYWAKDTAGAACGLSQDR